MAINEVSYVLCSLTVAYCFWAVGKGATWWLLPLPLAAMFATAWGIWG